MIVQELHRIQHRHGFLPEEPLRAFSEQSGVPLYRLQEVISFFPHFRREKPPRVAMHVCRDMACHLRGSCEVLAALRKDTSNISTDELVVEGVSCLGRCDRAPAAYVTSHDDAGEDFRVFTGLTVESGLSIINQTLHACRSVDGNRRPQGQSDAEWSKANAGSWVLDIYQDEELESYASIRRFIHDANLSCGFGNSSAQVEAGVEGISAELSDQIMNPRNCGPSFSQETDPERRRIIGALFVASLLGMGGAGGRTYKKWFDVRKAVGDTRYVVCNGDESEPGTFKDREIFLRAPHLVLEGLVLGGLFVGASRGYIYIRHEYPEQIESMREEIRRAESLGICGENILGSGYDFPVEVFVSPGGYICGEQTALIEAMEDRRGEPRLRPPELQTNGYKNMPTLLNNVETLAWIPAVVLKEDGRWFAQQGVSDRHLGCRLFSISGDVERPGVYEIKNGTTLRELIFDFAGGMRNGQSFQAVAPSGPSGGLLPARIPLEMLLKQAPRFVDRYFPEKRPEYDVLDLKLDIAVTRQLYGGGIGAGIVVYGDQANMVEEAISCLKFFRNETCGKCVPCRIGSQKVVEIAGALQRGYFEGRADAFRVAQNSLDELSETMKLTAICGLGTVACNPWQSLVTYFPDAIEAKLRKRKGE